jgi:hypothetical protein
MSGEAFWYSLMVISLVSLGMGARTLWAGRTKRTDIQGEAFEFNVCKAFGGSTMPPYATWMGVGFTLAVSNHGSKTTTIELQVDGSELQPRAEFKKWFMPEPGKRIPTSRLNRLPPGQKIHLYVTMEAEFPGLNLEAFKLVDLAPLRIWLIDGFGVRHAIPIRRGEVLKYR